MNDAVPFGHRILHDRRLTYEFPSVFSPPAGTAASRNCPHADQLCTTVFQHNIEVVIEDPSRRLGSPPIDVSIFDRQLGYERSWALKSIGPSSPERPNKTN